MITWIAGLLAKPVLSIPGASSELFLTFDDGPDPGSTPRVLDRLADSGAKATFFVIAERARKHAALVRRIQGDGHAIGNHSLDHGYRTFFAGRRRMLDWVRRSEEELRQLTGAPSVGFRPPVGIVTPELAWALREAQLPLILWNQRFFDTRRPWTEARALASLQRTSAGSIVLLHDRQPPGRQQLFGRTLAVYIAGTRRQGLTPARLTRELCARSASHSRPNGD